MSIQTRSKRRNNNDRGGRSIKIKQESFFSGALKRLQKTKIKKSKEKTCAVKIEEDENDNHSSKISGALTISNDICEAEKHSTDMSVISDTTIRSSLFEKFKLPKINLNENAPKFSTFEYHSNDTVEMKCTAYSDTDAVQSSCKNDSELGMLDLSPKPFLKCLQLGKEKSLEQSAGISLFASEILKNVKQKIDYLFQKDVGCHDVTSGTFPKRLAKTEKIFNQLPRMAVEGNSQHNVKDLASEYLNSFLSAVCDADGTVDEPTEFEGKLCNNMQSKDLDGENDFHSAPSIDNGVRYETESCSFGDTLFDEGYLSKPLHVQSACPWPTSDRCLLSSRVESKNGQIYVIKEQKCPKYQKREILADIKKKKKAYMLGHPPKYITPMEYHNRMLEHREHLERRQWQNIVHSQDYENLYHDKPPVKIPEYIYHNQTRHALTTNSQLLGYLASRASLFTDDTWERIEWMANGTQYPLQDLSPFHIDHFFYQLFFFSTAYMKGMRRSKKRKRSNLYQYFQPELYILPQHRLAKQQSAMLKYYPQLSSVKCPQYTGRSKTVPPEIAASLEGVHTETCQSTTNTSPSNPDVSTRAESKEAVPSLPEVPRASTSSPSKSPELRAVENVYCYKRKCSNLC